MLYLHKVQKKPFSLIEATYAAPTQLVITRPKAAAASSAKADMPILRTEEILRTSVCAWVVGSHVHASAMSFKHALQHMLQDLEATGCSSKLLLPHRETGRPGQQPESHSSSAAHVAERSCRRQWQLVTQEGATTLPTQGTPATRSSI